MSCYFRHIREIVEEAGIEVTPKNRRQVDRAIHQIVGVDYRDCPATWKALKQQIADEGTRQDLIRKLQDVIR